MCLRRDNLANSTIYVLTYTKIQKVGPPTPASSTRFQAYKTRLIPFSFLFQHKQMYIHTGETFKNVQSSPPPCTKCVSTWVTLSSTSPALTTDSDINDVSMYYCDLLLLPWVLCEICILSALFHDPSCFSFPKTKKCFSKFVFLQRVTLWNVEWQVQKS
jgi:hypothetical protein